MTRTWGIYAAEDAMWLGLAVWQDGELVLLMGVSPRAQTAREVIEVERARAQAERPEVPILLPNRAPFDLRFPEHAYWLMRKCSGQSLSEGSVLRLVSEEQENGASVVDAEGGSAVF